MKKPILLLTGLLIIAGAAVLLFFTSSLSSKTATATFSKNEESEGMSTLQVKAPYGYYVIRYDVVPRSRGTQIQQMPFSVGGSSIPSDPAGLFGNVTSHSTFFPDTGTVDDIPVETHVRIASNLNTAATAKMPEEEGILSRCGIYLYVTKDRSVYESLESIVADWTIDAQAQE